MEDCDKGLAKVSIFNTHCIHSAGHLTTGEDGYIGCTASATGKLVLPVAFSSFLWLEVVSSRTYRPRCSEELTRLFLPEILSSAFLKMGPIVAFFSFNRNLPRCRDLSKTVQNGLQWHESAPREPLGEPSVPQTCLCHSECNAPHLHPPFPWVVSLPLTLLEGLGTQGQASSVKTN